MALTAPSSLRLRHSKTLHYDVKFRAIAFTTMKKSVQALKFEFDWPIPNISGHSFTGSYSSSVDCRVIRS